MPVLKEKILVAAFTVIAIFAFGQKQDTDSLRSLLKAMAKANIYEITNTVGYAGSISKQYEHFQQFSALATAEQLINIAAQNRNAVVRLYALQALRQRKIPIPEQLKQQFQNDRTSVKVLRGCEGDERKVNALFLQDFQSPYNLTN